MISPPSHMKKSNTIYPHIHSRSRTETRFVSLVVTQIENRLQESTIKDSFPLDG